MFRPFHLQASPPCRATAQKGPPRFRQRRTAGTTLRSSPATSLAPADGDRKGPAERRCNHRSTTRAADCWRAVPPCLNKRGSALRVKAWGLRAGSSLSARCSARRGRRGHSSSLAPQGRSAKAPRAQATQPRRGRRLAPASAARRSAQAGAL